MRPQTITPTQQADLAAWTTKALEAMPYMASVLLNLRPLNTPGLGTFACDAGYRLYVDFDAVAPWGVDACSEVLLHECFHLLAHDSERAVEYGATTNARRNAWNLASDAANNDDLVEAGCTHIAETGFLPSTMEAPDHLTAEHYMALLEEEQGENEGENEGEDEGEDGGSGNGSGQGDEPFAGCGSGSGGVAAPGELDQADDANGAAPATTEVERRVIDISTAAAIREAAAIGTVPAGLVAIAKQLLTPSKLPWKQILSSAIRRSIASRAGDTDVTYARRNRRRAYIDLSSNERIIRPGNYSPVPSLAVVRDTSGSMGAPQLNAVSVEIEGIAKQLGIRGEQLIVLDVDVEVAAKRQYRDFSQLEEVAGRGGTDMGVGIAAAAALRPKPNAIVVITDGMTPWPATRGNAPPTIAAIVGASDSHSHLVEGVPDWIRSVLVDLSAR